MPDYPGLSDLLSGRADVHEALRQVPNIHNLKVITAGAEGPRYSDLLQGPNVQKIFGELRDQAEYVVIDVAPITFNADAQTLASTSGGVLLVATALKTSRAEVVEAVDQLNHVSATMAGSIIISVNRELEKPPPADIWRYPPREVTNQGHADMADTADDLEPVEVHDHGTEVAPTARKH